MIDTHIAALPTQAEPARGAAQSQDASGAEQFEVGKRFEQLLWAEMLSHAGLEDAFTQSGGEAAAAFSRYVVESIAADLAEKHPLGLSSHVNLAPQSDAPQSLETDDE